MSASSINRKVAEQIKAKKKEQRDAENSKQIEKVDAVNSGQVDGAGVSPETRDSDVSNVKETVKVSKKAVTKKPAAKKVAKKSSS